MDIISERLKRIPVTNITLDKAKPIMALRIPEVGFLEGARIETMKGIKTHHRLTFCKKMIDNVRTQKPSCSSDKDRHMFWLYKSLRNMVF
jgi:hypothetical protein